MEINLSELAIYVINMNTRYDRYNHIINQFKIKNLKDPIFIDAISDTVSRVGCAKSHLKAIETAQGNNHTKFIILEDDISFTNHHDIINKKFILPADIDCLYIGISSWNVNNKYIFNYSNNSRNIYKNNDNKEIVKLFGMLSGHGICYLSNRFIESTKKVLNDSIYYNLSHDMLLGITHYYFNVYALKEPVVYQDNKVGGTEEPTNISFV